MILLLAVNHDALVHRAQLEAATRQQHGSSIRNILRTHNKLTRQSNNNRNVVCNAQNTFTLSIALLFVLPETLEQ